MPLCGPVSGSTFQTATQEVRLRVRSLVEKKSDGYNTTNNTNNTKAGMSGLSEFNTEGLLLAMQTQKHEVDSMAKEIKSLQKEQRGFEMQLRGARDESKQELQRMKEGCDDQVRKAEAIHKQLQEKQRILEEELHDAHVQNRKLLVSAPAGLSVRGGDSGIHTIPEHYKQQFHERVSKFMTAPKKSAKLVKFQAITRGYLSRIALDKEKAVASAQNNGVMVALGSTEQGKSGWYVP